MRTANNVPYLSQANAVGQGFDIYGKYDVKSSAITPLLDPAKAGTKIFTFLGKEYAVPSYVDLIEATDAIYSEFTGETRESFQNSLSESANVHGSYGAFSGQMEQSYSHQFASNTEYFYSYRNFYSGFAMLQLIHDNLDEYLTDYFLQRVSHLPATFRPEHPDNVAIFADFFDDFGIYFTSQVTLGGSLEYYVAVNKSSQMSTTEISANVKLDYNALFSSGGVSADVKNTLSWQKYSANRSVNIIAKGGDPPLLAKVTSVLADQPGPESVAYYNEWLDSLDANPAITDFKLKGIWELCGSKSGAVEEAFHYYGPAMRPRMIIEASSEAGRVPIIILKGEIPPSEPPQYEQGYQLVILDRTNPSPTGIRLNKYYSFKVDNSIGYYPNAMQMYDQMLADIKNGQFDNANYFVVLASFGMSSNAPPNSSFYWFLRSAGGGAQLQNWVENASPGSRYEFLAVYAFTGVPNYGPGTGVEIFGADRVAGNIEFTKTIEVLFYKQRGGSLYSLGAGASS